MALLYVGYNLFKYGMTDSISATYYENPKGRVEGFMRLAFRAFCIILGFGVFQWITDDSWASFMIFFGGAAIALVGIAPDYKSNKIANNVHIYAAVFGIVLSLAGQWIVYGLWMPSMWVAITFAVAHLFKVRGATWYIEVMAIAQILVWYLKIAYGTV